MLVSNHCFVVAMQHTKWKKTERGNDYEFILVMMIHERCAIVKMVTENFSENFVCRKCEAYFGGALEQEEKL